MHPRPLPDKFLGGTGFHLTFKQLAIEIESSILSLILRMKMGRAMVPVKHTDDDTKKYANCRRKNFNRKPNSRPAIESPPLLNTAGRRNVSRLLPFSVSVMPAAVI